MVQLKRAYDAPSNGDGCRILVDRLWPRGLSHKRAAIDLWKKEIAPSVELRKWFDHDPARFEEFSREYTADIRQNLDPITRIEELAEKRTVTLVFGAKDRDHNHAVVIQSFLTERLATRSASAVPRP